MYILNNNNQKILNMRDSDKVFDDVINYMCTCVLKLQKCNVLIITIIAPLKYEILLSLKLTITKN